MSYLNAAKKGNKPQSNTKRNNTNANVKPKQNAIPTKTKSITHVRPEDWDSDEGTY